MLLSAPKSDIDSPDSPTPPKQMLIFSPNIAVLFEKAFRLQSALAAKALFEKNHLMQQRLTIILRKIDQAKKQGLTNPTLWHKSIAVANEISNDLVTLSDEMNRVNLIAHKYNHVQTKIKEAQLKTTNLGFSPAFEHEFTTIIQTLEFAPRILTTDLGRNIVDAVNHACDDAQGWIDSADKKLTHLESNVAKLQILPAAEQKIVLAKLASHGNMMTALNQAQNAVINMEGHAAYDMNRELASRSKQIKEVELDNTLSDEEKTKRYNAFTAQLQSFTTHCAAQVEELARQKAKAAEEYHRAPAYR